MHSNVLLSILVTLALGSCKSKAPNTSVAEDVTSAELTKPSEALPPKPPALPTTDRYGDALPKAAMARLGSGRLMHAYGAIETAFSADGGLLVTVSGNNSGPDLNAVKLWRAEDGKHLHTLTGKTYGPLWALAISPDGSLVAGASEGLSVWNAKDGTLLYSKEWYGDTVTAMAFTRDNKILAVSGSNEGMSKDGPDPSVGLRLFEAHTGTAMGDFEGKFEDGLHGLAFSPDEKTLALASSNKILLFDMATKKVKRRIRGGPSSALAYNRDGSEIWGDTLEGVVHIKTKGGGPWRYKRAEGKAERVSRAANADLLVLRVGAEAVIVDAKSDATIKTIALRSKAWPTPSLSPNGKRLAIANADGQLDLFDVDSGKRIADHGHRRVVNHVEFSPAGDTVVSASDDGTVRIWKLDGTLLKTISEYPRKITRARFRPDGSELATTGDDAEVRIYSTEDWSESRRLQGHTQEVKDIGWLSGGNLISGGGGELWRWDQGPKRVVHEALSLPKLIEVESLAVAPDGQRVYVGDSEGVIIDLTGKAAIIGDGLSNCVTAVWREKLIFAGGGSGPELLDSATGLSKRDVRFPGHRTSGVAVSSTGLHYAAVGWQKPGLFSPAGKQLASLDPHPAAGESRARSVAFSPDDKMVVVGYADGEILIYSVDALLDVDANVD